MVVARTPAWLRTMLLVAVLLAPAPALAVDLVGTWHVLVHYKDSGTNHPERERWEDRIWEFSMEGSRLKWIDYPIVVFNDQSGRFDLSMGRSARVLEFWEPNAAQQAEIEAGLQINPRGSRTKTLRGSPEKGWTSAKKGSGYQSARFITYTETWSIDDPQGAPVFTFDDSMGSASTESFEGRTRYTGESVEPGLIRGAYDRDGTRIGTFRATKAGATVVVKGSGKSQGERVYEAFFGAAAAALYTGELPGGVGTEEEVRALIDAGEFSKADRKKLREGLAEAFFAQFQNAREDDEAVRAMTNSLARKAEKAFTEDGKSVAEIQQMLQRGEIAP